MSKIIGGTPHGQGDALVDTTGAVLLDGVAVVAVHALGAAGVASAIVLELEGRINHDTDRHEQLYITDSDGAASIIAELLALAARGGFADELHDRIRTRLAEKP